MRRVVLAALFAACATAGIAAADAPVPDRRAVLTQDVDFFGGDLQPFFDTDLRTCHALCLNDPACTAFTFNATSRACFPKASAGSATPFAGAISGRVFETGPSVIARAERRAGDTPFLSSEDLARAREAARALGPRHVTGEADPAALVAAAQAARARGAWQDAVHWAGAAVARTDAAGHWALYRDLLAEAARDVPGWQDRAFEAAVNAWLRSAGERDEADALAALAERLEQAGRGRDAIGALRLAQARAPSPALADRLDTTIARYGFRVVSHDVDSDLADPRLCVEFSEPLIAAGQDYTPFVRLPDPRLAVRATDNRLCVTGLTHGTRVAVTIRAGLPASDGEVLARDVPIAAYVRDRSPDVRFSARAYVLPRGTGMGIPVETVNTDTLDLVLRHVSDRNILRTAQEGLLGRPLSAWDEDRLASDIAEEVWRGTAEVGSTLNADMTTRLPMDAAIADAPPGLYALTAALPGQEPWEDGRATQWFLLSDIGLASFAGSDGLTVVARRLSDGTVMQGVTVEVLSRSNRVLATMRTGPDGIATVAPGLLRGTAGAAPALLTARDGADDLTFLSLTDPAFDLSDRGVAGREPPGPLDAFLATDRGVFRPGETIRATVLLRDARARAVPSVPLTAILTRPDGAEHMRLTDDGGVDGGRTLALPLPGAAPRGTWTLAVHADPGAAPLAVTRLLVEDFVPERIDFDLDLPDGPVDPGAPPDLRIDARYLFGAPGAGLRVEGEVNLSAGTTLEGFPGYRFGLHDSVPETRRALLPPDVATRADGTAHLPLPLPEMAETEHPRAATVEVRLTEGSGRPVARSIDRAIAPSAPLIGIRPDFDGALPEGATAAFDLIALDPGLEPAAMPVRWQIDRIETRYQWYELYGQWNWEPFTTRETVAAGTADIGDGPVRISAPVDWGRHALLVEGPGIASSVGFDAGWHGTAEAADSPDMLRMALDADAYRPGDTARLRIVPRAPGTALVTVLADRIVAMRMLEVGAGETVIDLPVTDDWGAGVYVAAQVVRAEPDAADRVPVRALGLSHAAVDPGPAQLEVTLDVADRADPRATLRGAVTVDGVQPGETAHVTLAAVDEGILALTGFASPDPSAHYFGQRRLGVELRDLYGRLIDGRSGAMGRIRSGGDASLGLRMMAPPPTDATVTLFDGPLQVGPDGRAAFDLPMPDFNGTVRLMAVAWSATGIGQAEARVLVRDPVAVTAALPRFLAPGDESRLRLDLHHLEGAAGDMALSVRAPALSGDVDRTLTLTEGGRAVVEIPLRADMTGDAPIAVRLTLPDGRVLARDLTLGVRANDPPVTQTRRVELAPGQTLALDDALFAGFRPAGVRATVSAGPLAQIDAAGHLAALRDYPYGCTEQLTSRALPLVAAAPLAGLLGPDDAAARRAQVEAALATILARQTASGSFGLWQAEAGDFWLDAYVTDFLSRARQAGFEVPDRAFKAALDALATQLAYAPDFERGGEALAYALHVLAREGRAAMGDLRYYADTKAAAFATPLSLAQLGAALAAYGDPGRADALFRAADARLRGDGGDASRWRPDYGSVARDAAATLALAVEAGSTAVDRAALASRLAPADAAASPQDHAWTTLAAAALTADPAVQGLAMDGTPVTGAFVRHLQPGATHRVQNTGTEPIPVTLTTQGIPGGATVAGGYGYSIARDYRTLDGQPATFPVAQGTRLVTVLTVRPAGAARARLMIDDPLPAGLEIDNPALLRAGDIAALDWLDTAPARHAEFRADRFLAAVDQEGDAAIRLAYIVRAVTPGTFHHPAARVEDMYRPAFAATTASGRIEVMP